MALSDKNILITPNVGATGDPTIVFTGADASNKANITMRVFNSNTTGTISFEGNSGQLFSITDSQTGTIFSVNDISGIPSIEVIDTGLVKLAQYSGNVVIGSATDNNIDKLQVNGSISGTQLRSTVTTGTAPFVVLSTTQVPNLAVTTSQYVTGLTSANVTTALGYVPLNSNNAVTSSGTAQYVTANAQANITSVGTLTGLSVNGTITANGAAPQISLTNATRNWVAWSTAGVAAPNLTTRSAGTKLVLYPDLSGSNLDYAVGVESGALWFSAGNSGNGTFKWYVGNGLAATLSGAGNFAVNSAVVGGNITVNALSVNNTVTIGSTLGVTGNVNGSSLTLSGSAVINGAAQIKGGIQATPIGNASASTGNFTTIGATGTFTGTIVNAATIGNSGASLIGSLSNSLTINNTGSGSASGSTYNGSGAITISHNSIGAAPQAGNSSIVTVGTVTAGTWNAAPIALGYGGTGQTTAQLSLNALAGNTVTSGYYLRGNGTNVLMAQLSAADLTGTIPSLVLGNSTHYVGTTAITLNRGSAVQVLTGVSINGTASTVSSAAQGNITSVGILTGLTLSGALVGTTLSASGNATVNALTVNNSATIGTTLSAGGIVKVLDTTQAASINTGALQVSGGASITKDLYVAGNIYTANLIAITTANITVKDPLLYLSPNLTYPYNYSIGMYSAFTGGAGNVYQHTGVVRDQSDGVWKFFSNVVPEPGLTIDFTNARYDSIKVGAIISNGATFSGTVTGTTVQAATIGNVNAVHIGSGAALTSLTGANVTGTVPLATTATYVTGLTSTNVTTALGYTPYNATNPSGYISSNGSITGSAATLTTARTIAMTGDVTYTSGLFNGSANVTGVATLANSGATAGTYNNLTVNAKGLVTGGSNVAYLTAYTDTLASVTGRGANTASTISLTNTSVSLTTLGKVGIGTDTPTVELEVNGAAYVSGSGSIGSANGIYAGTTGNQILLRAPTPGMPMRPIGFGDLLEGETDSYGYIQAFKTSTGDGIDPHFLLGTSSEGVTFEEYGSIYGSLMFATGTTERMRITANGNVGIGTTTPTAKLAVNGPATASSISLTSPGLSLTTVGDVGIGTNNPSVTLEVNGSAYVSGLGSIGTDNGMYAGTIPGQQIFLRPGSAGMPPSPMGLASLIEGSYNGYGYLQALRASTGDGIDPHFLLGTSSEGVTFEEYGSIYGSLMFATSTLERMRITANGNVGIGTTTPTAMLAVNGTASVGSTLSVAGNMFTTGQFASVSNQLVVQAPAPQAEGAQIVLAWANVSGLTGQGNKTWNIDVDATNNLRFFNQDAIGGTTVPFMIRQTTSNVEIIANASVSGNIRVGNVFANGYFWANGNAFTGAGGGGGGTPGGSTTQIQYNNGGLFGGITGFTWNGTTLTAASGFQATPIGNTTPSTGNFTSLNTSGNSTANALTVNNSATIGSTLGVAGNLTVGSGPAGGNISGVNVLTANTVVVNGTIYRSNRNVVTNYTGNTAPVSPKQGDEWYYPITDTLYKYINDGINNVWISLSSALYSANTGAVANSLALRDAAANLTATNFNGVASSAKYADLAEKYTADSDYPAGTVVVFGGSAEVTITSTSHDTRAAGVVSTNPAYLMNSETGGVAVALTGRVPCKVRGPVRKGDLLVTSTTPGVAQPMNVEEYKPGCVIGKSLENFDINETTTIEVVVGRF
jgi:hypothetical protein